MKELSDVITLAKSLQNQGDSESAKVCADLAETHFIHAKDDLSAKCAMRSLAYSVGIFSVAFRDASKITGIGWPIR